MTRLICAVSAAASCAATIFVLAYVLRPEPPPSVSWEELRAAVERGDVDTIEIDGDVYEFRGRHIGPARARGAAPTLASIRALRPSDSKAAPPKISFRP
ncbi:MAG TPA: hypothetical protein VIF62_21430 [Labilithrix sp.]